MHFQISRNGQTYGPYTLEDLQRYLASGNVLANDLAKSEEMADWLPVSQILAGHTGVPAAAPVTGGTTQSAADSTYAASGASSSAGPAYTPTAYSTAYNPGYLPPAQVNAALAVSHYPDAPNLHWALVLLFSLFTCGVFMLVWNLVVTAWLKRVQPNATALLYYIAAGICVVLMFLTPGASAHYAFGPGLHTHHGGSPFGSLLFVAHWILKLVARFSERNSLEEHFNGPEPIGLRLNPVMTFFFGGLYFQYHLTRINDLKRAARFGQPAPYAY